ncbi:amidohydrolase [Legionella lytica]|uniref:Amidohydrolase n=1 Tax=Legionella lytica TaxID=96232 RepID=A0ABW8DC98_9GAMM
MNTVKQSIVFKNVRLETGFIYEEGEISGTRTDLFLVEIANGKITNVLANAPNEHALDAKGMLMLPAFKDMHVHLDKTLYGLPWKAVPGKSRTIKDMIALEQHIIPELLNTSIHRSEQLIELLQSYGISYARSHFNIEPSSGLNSLEHLEIALEHKKDSFSAELVAFPQHGIYYTQTESLMREVAQFKSVGFLGGLDPTSIDGSIEKPIDFTVALALEHNKGIDIHLHETGNSGVNTIDYLVDKALENPQLAGKVYISHAYVFAFLPEKEVERLASRLAEAKIGIATAVPFRNNMVMPLPTLWKHGVKVVIGNDNIQDHWGTLGSGNLLQKANIAADLYGLETEFALSRLLKMATNKILPLNDQGKQQWPKAGDDANMVFLDASCSAEVVSRMSCVKSLIHQGNIVY